MMKILNQTIFKYRKALLNHKSLHYVKGIHEPEYLDLLRPQIPYYPLLNVQIRGYDYAVLESYESYLHRLFNKLGVSVAAQWCAPHVAYKYDNLKSDSDAIQCTHYMNHYERNLQIENLSVKVAPIFLELVHSSIPPGVKLSIHKHDYELHEKSRYIPDLQLAAFKKEFAELKVIDEDLKVQTEEAEKKAK